MIRHSGHYSHFRIRGVSEERRKVSGNNQDYRASRCMAGVDIVKFLNRHRCSMRVTDQIDRRLPDGISSCLNHHTPVQKNAPGKAFARFPGADSRLNRV
jgi:hypothetical protein